MSLDQYSNMAEAQRKAIKYLGKGTELKTSDRKDKKYMLLDPSTQKMVYFGQMGYEDFTKHKDPERRKRYLDRATKIKGDWIKNKYSPNNLAINILW
jgi:hypothetical protein